MNELTFALTSAFSIFEDYFFVFVGIPIMCFTVNMACRLFKIMRMPPRISMIERSEIPALSEKKPYFPPLLDLHKCPVSRSCEKCRFFESDRCLKSYL